MGQSFVNGQFFIATLNNQRVYVFPEGFQGWKAPSSIQVALYQNHQCGLCEQCSKPLLVDIIGIIQTTTLGIITLH